MNFPDPAPAIITLAVLIFGLGIFIGWMVFG